ncbi:MAG: ABC transporter permease [Clostridiales Family XIII bacterium]|jgi:ABC-2 type transport system permease protein|nr:ABC transporter permease [Clostridiales Family XIII bacterium]
MFIQAKSYILTYFRDKSAMFFSLLFPALLCFVLGTMLQSLDNPDAPLGEIRIAAAAEGGGDAFRTGTASFLDALRDSTDVTIVGSAADADVDSVKAAVDAGEADAGLVFSEGKISVYEGADIVKSGAVRFMAQSFSRQYDAIAVAVANDPQRMEEILAVADQSHDGLTEKQVSGVNRSMMDFYAVAMIVMIAFMGNGIGGASTFFSMRRDGSLRRITASPKSRVQIFFGYMLGGLVQSAAQAAVVMLCAYFLYGASYADRWQDNVLLFCFFLLLGAAVSGMCNLFGLFVRFNPYTPLMAIFWAMLYMSGTFNKDIAIPGIKLPPAAAQEAAFDLTVFGRDEKTLAAMAVCAAIIAASGILGSLLLKRKAVVL